MRKKCVRCGKALSFFRSLLVSYCSDEEIYEYGTRLRVKEGFYLGQIGSLVEYYDCGWKNTYDYKIKLEDGTIIDGLDERQVEKVEV